MTRRLDEGDWERLETQFSQPCLDWLRPRLERDGFFETTSEEFGAVAGCRDAQRLLERLVGLEALETALYWACSCCGNFLIEQAAGEEVCVHCGNAFVDCPAGVTEERRYSSASSTGRSVPWVLVLHGMNTAGPWQEELSWLVSTTYGRSVPVFIYKYGKIRPGVLFRWRQAQLRNTLTARIQALAGSQELSRFGPRPDVIAHSLGTLLLGQALEAAPTLKVGRVILAGSILRPDFDWEQVFQRGQVEQVLNHWGRRDIWTRFAQFAIPGSGPSGAGGFAGGGRVLNRGEDGFTHSAYFKTENLPATYSELWQPFLKRPEDRLPELSDPISAVKWKPAFCRAPRLPMLLLAILFWTAFFILLR